MRYFRPSFAQLVRPTARESERKRVATRKRRVKKFTPATRIVAINDAIFIAMLYFEVEGGKRVEMAGYVIRFSRAR